MISFLDPDWAANRIQSGLVSGEGLIFHVRDPVTKLEEIRAGGKNSAVTGEQVIVVDEGVKDKRLLAVETELSRTFKAMNRDSNTLSGVLRQAWDCQEKLQTMTKNNPNQATNAHVSVIGHTTSADVLQYLTAVDSSNGFANRFLWISVWRTKVLPDGGNLVGEEFADIRRRLQNAFVRANAVTEMSRDYSATLLWREVYGALSGGRPGLLGEILGRADPQVMRLACLYALLDGTDTVKVEHLTAALAVWDYCEASVRYVFGERFGDPEMEKLCDALRNAPEGLTRTQIRKDVFANHPTKGELEALLQRAIREGLARCELDKSTGGRPSERWFSGGAVPAMKGAG
jgi:hypothetical protein